MFHQRSPGARKLVKIEIVAAGTPETWGLAAKRAFGEGN
jgi:hypothetical protein